MADARYHANAVRLRARFADGRALVEFLRRAGPGKVAGDGFYRAAWPHDLQVEGVDLAGVKAAVAQLPLVVFAPDPDDVGAAVGRPQPVVPGAAGASSPRPRPAPQEPARRGFLAAHYSTREDS